VKKRFKVIVIGQNPADRNSRKKDFSFNNASALGRLNNWMDKVGVKFYSFSNAVSTPGKVTKDMIDYDRLVQLCKGYKNVLALGEFPSKALDKININHFKLPHPSGLNRQINDHAFIEKRLTECKDYLCNI
jgi:uracil-DNA glycosylase